jgi:hypothetical protein
MYAGTQFDSLSEGYMPDVTASKMHACESYIHEIQASKMQVL